MYNFYDMVQSNEYRVAPYRTILLKEDGTFFDCRYALTFIKELEDEWNEFKDIPAKTKEVILETLHGLYRSSMAVRYHAEHIDDFIQKFQNRNYRRLNDTEEE